jgi:hypothetical protein
MQPTGQQMPRQVWSQEGSRSQGKTLHQPGDDEPQRDTEPSTGLVRSVYSPPREKACCAWVQSVSDSAEGSLLSPQRSLSASSLSGLKPQPLWVDDAHDGDHLREVFSVPLQVVRVPGLVFNTGCTGCELGPCCTTPSPCVCCGQD